MRKYGFTLPEIVIVGGIMVFLLGLGSINLLRPQRQAEVASIADTLIADLSSQQIKSMVGDVSTGGGPSMHGVYFGSDSYTLFKGDTYSPSNETNFTVQLPSPQTFSSISFPSGVVLFAQRSGEFQNFAEGSDSVTLTNGDSGESIVLRINRFGVVTDAD